MAARYWRGTGNGNWGSTGNWSDTSGGATGFSVPGAADDVTFDGNGNNNCNIDTSARSCLTLTITAGYTANITFTQALQVVRNTTGTAANLGANFTTSGGGYLSFSNNNPNVVTIISNGVALPGLVFAGTGKKTLNGSITCSYLQGSGTCLIAKTTSETITVNGNITIGASTTFSSQCDIYQTAGTWSGTGNLSSNLFLQGNVTVSGTVSFLGGRIKYVSGTITTTGSTLGLSSSPFLDTNGVTWSNVTLSNTTAQTYTIESLFSISGTLTIGTGATTIFAGTAGFNVATLSCAATAVQTIAFKDGVTYTITQAFNCFSSRVGSIVLFTSSSGTVKANLVLPNNGNNLCNVLASFTRIDASGGRSITTFGGTVSDCVNVVQYYDWGVSAGGASLA
jgi:hypothetical protein